jgi:hypothetical protein
MEFHPRTEYHEEYLAAVAVIHEFVHGWLDFPVLFGGDKDKNHYGAKISIPVSAIH